MSPRPPLRALRPCPTTQLPGTPTPQIGGREGPGRGRGRPGLGVPGRGPFPGVWTVGRPAAGGRGSEGGVPAARRGVRPRPSARRPLTWRAGARRAEPAGARGGGCGAASTKRGPSSAGAGGAASGSAGRGGEGRGPRPARDPAPAAACVRREGRGLFVSARPGRRARSSPGRSPGVRSPRAGLPLPRPRGVGGSRAPVGAGWDRSLRRPPPLPARPREPRGRRGRGLGVRTPGAPAILVSPRVSPRVVPFPGPAAPRRAFPWRGRRAPAQSGDKRARGGGWGAFPTVPAPPPPPSAPSPSARAPPPGPLCGPPGPSPGSQGARRDAPGRGGGGYRRPRMDAVDRCFLRNTHNHGG